eukprot:jgi/Mesvir1/20628/Mv14854-RA.1
MAMEITEVLLNAQNPDGAIRKIAEDNLTGFQERDYAMYLLSLSHELSNNGKPADSRRLAGLILKNALDAKDEKRKGELKDRWVALSPQIKAQVRAALLATLGASVVDARHTAAQVMAKIGAIELPRGEWPELIQSLLDNMNAQQSQDATSLKQATLQALGYVCEEIDSAVLEQDQVNKILTAVVQGIRKEEPSNDVRLAAMVALINAIDFAHTNFENEYERNFIMQVTCEATLCSDVKVRQAAFECLVAIAQTYYSKLVAYINELFNITLKAVKEDHESVALQAIELWSTIAEEEMELDEEAFEGDADVINHHFVKKALPALVPMLLETLTKQDEGQDADESAWNLAMAGGTCLGLVALTVADDIVPLVMPFVQENISRPDSWRAREAATFAFGSILEGPSSDKLMPLVHSALPFLLNAMKDANSHVKDTTAWTIGRILEFLHGPQFQLITAANFQLILQVLLEGLKDTPSVAEKVCWAISNLATGFEELADQPTSPLSGVIFETIVQALLVASAREDTDDTRLRSAAYESLNEVVRCAAEDTVPVLAHIVPLVMDKLNRTLEMQILSNNDREKQSELQGLLCGVLQVIIQKSSDKNSAALEPFADVMMQLFLRVFACRSATVHEEAMLAIGALAYATGPKFHKYMLQFYPYLDMGLKNYEEYQVCSITVGVVGDLARALEEALLPFCDGIVYQLLQNLQSNDLHRNVKPPILSCFGDIALAVGASFDKYLPYVAPMLQSAAALAQQQPRVDDDTIDYANSLVNGIFEAYSGILQGFKGHKAAEQLAPHADHILSFLQYVANDQYRDDAVTKSAVGLLGDLADTIGSAAAPVFDARPFWRDFLARAAEGAEDDKSLASTAAWASGVINALVAR